MIEEIPLFNILLMVEIGVKMELKIPPINVRAMNKKGYSNLIGI